MKKEAFLRLTAVLLILLVVYGLQAPRPAYAATITVNTTADEFDAVPNATCSLREAIRAANSNASFGGCPAGAGDDIIQLPAGTYTLTTAGAGENSTATGDLDILSNITINGAGAAATIIDGNSLDRVFEIRNNANVTFNDVTISGGVVSGPGGGIHVSSTAGGSLNIIRSIIVNNTANGNNGGALFVGTGTATITDSAFIDNVSTVDGGGILIGGGATTITNSTISGNNANGSGGGIALSSATITSLTLIHVTVTSNTADADTAVAGDGGGIRQSGATTTLTVSNSIIAGNVDNTTFAANDCSRATGTFNTGDYNLRPSDTGCQTFLNNTNDFNVTASTLALEPLRDNGGPTPTHAALPGSPAVDRIPNATNGCGTTYTVDQRALTRPVDYDLNSQVNCDIGAFERQAAETFTATVNDGGTVTFGATLTRIVDAVSGNAPGNVTVTRHNQPPGGGVPGQGELPFHVNINAATSTGLDINLTLCYTDWELTNGTTGVVENNLTLYRWNGSTWVNQGVDALDTTGNCATKNNVTDLSSWTLASGPQAPTAVSLQTFQADSTPIALVSVSALLVLLLLLTVGLLWRRRAAIVN